MRFLTTILPLAFIATATASALPSGGFLTGPGPAAFPNNGAVVPTTNVDQETCGSITGQLAHYNVPLTATIVVLYDAFKCSPDTITAHDFLLLLVGGRLDIYAKIEAVINAKIVAAGWDIVLTKVTVAELVTKCGLNVEIDTVSIFLTALDLDVHAFIAFWVQLSVTVGVSEQSCKVISF
ncbi:hypothetical protein Tdes44962_MAKER04450 [Teratosphaeria destructans]|uniref:Uncharacterized protein n=1 Tax=Teratosphaeria destructans TaxID=418781 RepID=A0A9W7SMD2_9PEZI|nr:hypothetical protein Tdes44962_MAKER04450 [Teratosphaeria destructans]